VRKKILIVVNPKVRDARLAYLARVITALNALGCAVEQYVTQAPLDAIVYLQSRDLSELDLVVAAGGDGTVNEVVNGLLLHPDLPLGIIPTGTANVLAIELRLPKSASALARVLAHGQTRAVYIARLNGKRFLAFAGVGYDAWVVKGIDLKLKHRVGKGAYVWSMLQQFAHYGQRRYTVDIDGSVYSASSLVVTNCRHYAGRFILSRRASLHTATLQIVLLQSASRWSLLMSMLGLLFGCVEWLPSTLSKSAKTIKVTADINDVVQADGDIACNLPAFFEIEAQPARVVCP
jgi:diacylglycerol kinase (ATP)